MTKAPKSAAKGKTVADPAAPVSQVAEEASVTVPEAGVAPAASDPSETGPEIVAQPVPDPAPAGKPAVTPPKSASAASKAAAAAAADPVRVDPVLAEPEKVSLVTDKVSDTPSASPFAKRAAAPSDKPEDTKPPAPILAPKPDPAPKSDTVAAKAEPKPDVKPPVKPTAAPVTSAPVVAEERGSSFWPALLGGVVAAGLGAAAVIWLFPQGIRPPASDGAAALEQALADQRARIGTLESEIAALRSAPAVPDGTAALSDELNARISALEAGQGGGAGVDDLRAQIAALTQRIDGSGDFAAAEARIREAQDQAARLAREAQARAALSHLQAALDTGSPLDQARADLQTAGVIVPESLSGSVPSLSVLQASFPDAARAGLQASLRATRTDGGWGDRALAYLQSATGARSLSPQAGTDPDAVLSRAEAALGADDLAKAVTEIEALPPEGQQAMTDWIVQARLRIAAEAAVAGIATGLN